MSFDEWHSSVLLVFDWQKWSGICVCAATIQIKGEALWLSINWKLCFPPSGNVWLKKQTKTKNKAALTTWTLKKKRSREQLIYYHLLYTVDCPELVCYSGHNCECDGFTLSKVSALQKGCCIITQSCLKRIPASIILDQDDWQEPCWLPWIWTLELLKLQGKTELYIQPKPLTITDMPEMHASMISKGYCSNSAHF